MQRPFVERARDGDIEAFSYLVTMWFPRLDGVVKLMMRDPDRAQGAVQRALFTAWRDLRALGDPDAWDAWLRRSSVRACKDGRRSRIEVHVEPHPAVTRMSDAVADIADRDWLRRELACPEIHQRAVLVLHYYLDLPVSEVADTLGIPYGTAAFRFHRGLETMRASVRAGRVEPGALATERSA